MTGYRPEHINAAHAPRDNAGRPVCVKCGKPIGLGAQAQGWFHAKCLESQASTAGEQ